MAKTLKLIIEADAKTGDLQVVGDQLEKLDSTAKRAGDGIDKFVSKLKKIGGAALGFYTLQEGLEKVLQDGLAFNRMIEEQSNGIRSLIVATSENFDSLGRQLTLQEKYNLAQKESVEIMRELNQINTMTPHTLDQTAQIYKALYTNAKKYGATQKEMIEMTKLISIAAGNAGIAFDQLLASVDGLANGTFDVNSEMGRFLKSIGLAPAKLRELAKEGKSVEEILNKLRDFDFDAGTMSQSLSNLENAWNQFAGNITKSIFDEIKPALNGLADIFNDLNKAIFGDAETNRLLESGVFELNGIDEVNKKAQLLYSEIEKIDAKLKSGVGLWDTFFGDSEIDLTNKKAELERQLKDLADTVGTYTEEVMAGQAKLISSSINTSILEGMKITTFDAIDDVMAEMAKKFNDLTKGLKPDSKAYKEAMTVYNKEMERLTKQATKLWETEEKKKAEASKRAAEEAARAYKKLLSDMQRLNEQITKDWMKATSDKTEYELYTLEQSYANRYKKIEELEKEAQRLHKESLIQQLEMDKKLLGETFEKQRIDAIHKSQTSEMKLWEDFYNLIGEKEIAIEIEKAEKRNEIIEKYGDKVTEEQLQKALEASDKMIEAQRKAAQQAVDIWKEAADEIANSFENAFANLLKTGNFEKSFKGFLGDMTNSIIDTIAKGTVGGGNLFDLIKGGFTTGFNTGAGQIDALFGNALGINNWLGSNFGTSLGAIGMSGTVGYYGGKLSEKLLGGSKTQSANYAAIGAAAGSVIPGVGTLVGGVTGALLGGLNAKWQKKDGGVIIDDWNDIQQYTKYEKDKIFGFMDKTKYEYSQITGELRQYFDGIKGFVNEVNDFFGKEMKFELPKEKISFKNLDKEISESLLRMFAQTKKEVGGVLGSLFGGHSTDKFNIVDYGIMKAKFEQWAKSIEKSVTEAIIDAFKFESGILTQLDDNLQAVFGDFGKQISDSLMNSFKNNKLETIPDFDDMYSDMLLKQISGYEKAMANAIDNATIDTSNVENSFKKIFIGVQNALNAAVATVEINADFNEMKQAWEDWAAQQGVTVVEAINAGLESVKIDKAQFENFFNDYFDLNGSVELLREQAIEAGNKLKEAFDTVGQSFNLQNFEEIRSKALEGFNFTPENIADWHEAQVALENAATATRSFVEALKGMIGEFDGVIAGFDNFINKLRGINIEEQNVVETKLQDVLNTIAKLEQADNTKEILDLSKQTLTEVQGLKTTFDDKLQGIIDGTQKANDEFVNEVKQTLQVGLSETLKDIVDVTSKLDEAKKLGDDDAINRLTEELNRLNQEKTDIADALNKLNEGGLTKGIAQEIQGAIDKSIAQIAERGEQKAIDEQQALINELQAQTAILQNIEGVLTKDADGSKILEEALNNIADTMKNDETKQAITDLPDKIVQSIEPMTKGVEDIPNKIDESMQGLAADLSEAFNQVGESINEIPNGLNEAMQPLGAALIQTNESIGQLPESFVTALEPLSAGMEATNEAISQLPDAFNASLEPVTTAIAEIPNAFNDSMQPLIDSFAEMQTSINDLPNAFNESLQPLNESIAELPNAFNDSMVPLIDSINLLPEAFNESMAPVTESIAELPNAFNESMAPLIDEMNIVNESIAMLPESFNAAMQPMIESINMLPESFNAAMAPVIESLGQVSESVKQIAPELRAGIAEAMQPVQAAVSELSGTIGQLVAAENATTGAVVAAGNQIAGAVSGLTGMLSAVQAEARAAAQAANTAASISQQAVSAAAEARAAAAQAADSNAALANSMDRLSAVTNVQTQTAGA